MSQLQTVVGRPGRLIVAHLDPGTQLLESIEEICRIHDINSAFIASVVGSVSEVYLRNANENTTLPIGQEHEGSNEIDTLFIRRKLEILSVQGNISRRDGKTYIHSHGLFSEVGGKVHGGHIFRATVWSQGEVYIQELVDAWVDREMDTEATGMYQMKLMQGNPE